MKQAASPESTSRHTKTAWPALCATVAALLLTGCPASKLPDVPPSVPQPKASLHLFPTSLEI